ncbi:MAG: acyl carrier protein [Bacteroidetes bacterium]|nr:acyl carrier protein [Bacteroidota bacterium]
MHDKIVDLIITEVEEINEQITDPLQVEFGIKTPLFDALNSMRLVTLIVAVEQSVEDEFGTALVLANEKAMSRKNNPFKTIGTFADYIVALLKENGNGNG